MTAIKKLIVVALVLLLQNEVVTLAVLTVVCAKIAFRLVITAGKGG